MFYSFKAEYQIIFCELVKGKGVPENYLFFIGSILCVETCLMELSVLHWNYFMF